MSWATVPSSVTRNSSTHVPTFAVNNTAVPSGAHTGTSLLPPWKSGTSRNSTTPVYPPRSASFVSPVPSSRTTCGWQS